MMSTWKLKHSLDRTTAKLGKPWIAAMSFCCLLAILAIELSSQWWQLAAILSSVIAAFSFVSTCLRSIVETAKRTRDELVKDLGVASDIYGRLAALRGRALFGPIGWGGGSVALAKTITFEVLAAGHARSERGGGFFKYDLGYYINFEAPITEERVLQILFLPCLVREGALQASLSPRRHRAPSLTTMTFDLEPLVWLAEEDRIGGAAERHNMIVEKLKDMKLSARLLLKCWDDGIQDPTEHALGVAESIDVQYADSEKVFKLSGLKCSVPAGTRQLCLVARGWLQPEEQTILLQPPISCGELVLKVGCKGDVDEKITAQVGIQAGYDSLESRSELDIVAPCVDEVGNFADSFLTGNWVAKRGQCFAPVDSVVCRLGLSS